MGIATNAWLNPETDPQRLAILAAADRLLAGIPRRSTGSLSVVQLAVEADLKYWIIAQKHTDLRIHFQRLAAASVRTAASASSPEEELEVKYRQLRQHCAGLEKLLHTYATIINELSRDNQILRDRNAQGKVTPLRRVSTPADGA